MKNKLSIILLVLIICSYTYAQTTEEIVAQSKELVAQKKYASAFKTLNDFDPKNSKTDIVVEKIDIALKYHVNTIMHQFFSFADIGPTEDILDYRTQGKSFDLKMFSVQSVLDSLMKVYPENAKLNKSAGLFYFDVLINYGDNWLKEPYELVQLSEGNLTRAHLMDLADHETYYALGYLKLISNRIEQSVPDFLRSLEFNEKFAPTHFNLAYALQSINKNNDALTYARNAFNYYTNPMQKADAARMIGAIYLKSGEKKSAQQYFEQAYKLNPGYYNIRSLLDLYLSEKNNKAQNLLTEFFNLEPENPAIYSELYVIYTKNNQGDALIKFFENQLKKIKDNFIIIGNVHFYTSALYKESNKEKSKEHLLAAKTAFANVLEADHPVFNAIEETLKEF